MKLHLGCGLHTPDGWVNIDGSITYRIARWPIVRTVAARLSPRSLLNGKVPKNIFTHDVRRPLPFADDSVEAIYSSNMVEHLYLSEARQLFKECFRVLRPSGVLRIVVPDLAIIVRDYCAQQSDKEASPADLLNRRLGFYDLAPPQGSRLLRLYYNLRNADHKYMFDERALSHYFREAGFVEVARRDVFESRIPDIEAVEDTRHFTERHDLCVEGIKAARMS